MALLADRLEKERRPALARMLPALAMAVLVIAVQGCREDEQDRPFVYDKGAYGGPADEKLGQDQVDALRQRAAGQRM